MDKPNLPHPPSWANIRAAAAHISFNQLAQHKQAIVWNVAPGRHWWGHVSHKYRLFAYPADGKAGITHESKDLLAAVGHALEPLGYEVPKILVTFTAPSPRGEFNIVVRSHIKGATFFSRLNSLSRAQLRKAYGEYGELLGHIHTQVDPAAAPTELHPWNPLMPNPASERHVHAFACFMGYSQTQAKNWGVFLASTAADYTGLCDKPVFCHGDFSEWNVILRNNRIIAPYDFEMANQTSRALDFAHLTIPTTDLPLILTGYSAASSLKITIAQVEAARLRNVMMHAALGNINKSEAFFSLRENVQSWLKHSAISRLARQRVCRELGLNR